MIVALCTLERDAEPRRGSRVHAVDRVLRGVFIGVRATLGAGRAIAVKGAGDALFDGRVWKQVARDLLDRKLIEGLVGVESMDDVVAEPPHRARGVVVVAVRIGEARQIEPHLRHAFAVVRRSQHVVHQCGVSAAIMVGEERLHLFWRRRQTTQVQAEPADQRARLCLCLRRQLFLLQPFQHECVDGISHPVSIAHLGRGRAGRRRECPVLLPVRPLINPLPQLVDLRRRKLLA